MRFGKEFGWNLRHRFFGRELPGALRYRRVALVYCAVAVTAVNLIYWSDRLNLW